MAVRRVCDNCRHSRDAHTFSQRKDFVERRTDLHPDAELTIREIVYAPEREIAYEIAVVVERCLYRDGGGYPCSKACEIFVDKTDEVVDEVVE